MPRRSTSKGKKQLRPEPAGKLRRSQAITTFGPGSMLDLVQDAVVVGGLDFWKFDSKSGGAEAINEPRLRDAIADRFVMMGRQLRRENPFLEPPIGDDNAPTSHSGIQVLEFPLWFVCQNANCRRMVRSDHLELKKSRYLHMCDDGKKAECVPMRFVGACKRGHLQDFPWKWFVHSGGDKAKKKVCAMPRLQLQEGATGDFSEVVVKCETCGAARSLVHAMEEKVNPPCLGRRPWLGSEGGEPCDEHIRLLVRTASNAYFSQVVSALSIPDAEMDLRDQVDAHWNVLKVAKASNLPVFRDIPEVGAALEGYPDEEVLQVVEAIRNKQPIQREPIRTAEFKKFVEAEEEVAGDIPPPDKDFFARTVVPEDGLPAGVKRLVLARKLREVRVQIGFTRLESVTANLQGEYETDIQSAPLGLTTDWLPASEVLGEGIFLQLDEEAVRAWEKQEVVLERAGELLAGYEKWARERKIELPFPGPRFYLLHSLSHLLITALSLECGYAASAIRERIYCASTNAPTPMAAILLSTGTPGTEGTLGGLVEEGKWIAKHLAQAYRLGTLCSNDPVCARHSPKDDLTGRLLEGAACHGCLFIAECSCERFNQFLDRALVVPTIGHDPKLAFFGEEP